MKLEHIINLAKEHGMLINSKDRLSSSNETSYFVENCYFDIEGFARSIKASAELRRLHQQAERDIILLNRAANALAMLECITDPTLAAEIRDRLMQPGALPDLRD